MPSDKERVVLWILAITLLVIVLAMIALSLTGG